ncbi:MAG: cysteine hydrolase family protein [Capsulimonadaceae bacterium]
MTDTALLVMDVQNGIVERFSNDADYVPRLGRAVSAARAAGMPVIFVVVRFREGYPEVSPNNKSFGAIKQMGMRMTEADAATQVHSGVAPESGDVVVSKRRVSAFAGSDLDVVLRAKDIRHLVLTGIATSGVVLSTLRQAADLDFRMTVLSDACLDMDEEVHRVLLTKIFPRQADVLTIDEWCAALSA